MILIKNPKNFNFDLLIHKEYHEYSYDNDLDFKDGGGMFFVGHGKYKDYMVDVRDSGVKFCYYENILIKIINKDGTNRKLC